MIEAILLQEKVTLRRKILIFFRGLDWGEHCIFFFNNLRFHSTEKSAFKKRKEKETTKFSTGGVY